MTKQTRKSFHYEGRKVYEWDEGLDTITLFISQPPVPASIKLANALKIIITPQEIEIGLKEAEHPYLKHKFKGIAEPDESVWYLDNDNNEIVIDIQKAQKGILWGTPFLGHEQILNPLEKQELKKKLLLERFQEENPTFDFSTAQFNGRVPDARDFMGGVKYQ